jgi:ketosteroid isomerase-like protein
VIIGIMTTQELLQELYEGFNRREFDAVLARLAEDVKWANGMEGGFIDGRENVREYWERQFEIIDPQLEVLKIEIDEAGRAIVTVHQIIKDKDGNLLAEKTVEQIFTFADDLITLFELGDPAGPLVENENFKRLDQDAF